MLKRSVISALAVVVLISAYAVAQTIEVEPPKQLTFLPAGTNFVPSVATNGTEWGVAYMRFEKTYRIFFLRTTYDGEPIEGRAILEGEEDTFGFQHPRVTAYPKGWAMTYEYRVSGTIRPDRYFILLDKRGRKTGAQALLVKDQFTFFTPIWTGSMFVVFYIKDAGNGFEGIWVAYFDDKAKRIVPDRLITQPSKTRYSSSLVLPTSDGYALFGGEEFADEDVRPFFILVGLNGTTITGPKYIDESIEFFSPNSVVWNGSGYATAGMEFPGKSGAKARPAVRLLSNTGTWQGGPFRQTANGETSMNGIGFTGSGYVSAAINANNASIYCQQLNDRVKKVGAPLLVDDSNFTAPTSRLMPVGSDAFYFHSSKKAEFSKSASNIYYSRIKASHSGKPSIAFFNAAVHKFNGKKYALLDWHAAGSQTVKIKTKGGRWTLPASGFHAVEIKKDARFKIVASNKTGSVKAKVKVKVK